MLLSITETDFCSVTAMSREGFGYMWAGARATHGATRGRVCYEVTSHNIDSLYRVYTQSHDLLGKLKYISNNYIFVQMRIDSNQPTDHLANETNPNVLRVGW